MKQTTSKQHYLPKYRLKWFLRSNNQFFVYGNGRNRHTTKIELKPIYWPMMLNLKTPKKSMHL